MHCIIDGLERKKQSHHLIDGARAFGLYLRPSLITPAYSCNLAVNLPLENAFDGSLDIR